jgi:hypothetical protein
VDGIKFNVMQLFKYIIHHFGLSEEAKMRKVAIAITVDGAPLDDKTGYITIGFKVCDKDAVDPVTKQKIFNDDDDGPNLESGKFAFPLQQYWRNMTSKLTTNINGIYLKRLIN